MNKLALQEFEKLSASGIVGDLLTLGFLGRIASKAVQQGKGVKEALKAGATFGEAIKADALPIGKHWRFNPLTKRNRVLTVARNKLKAPHKGKSAYEHNIDKQQDLASTIAMPAGLGLTAYGVSKKNNK